MNNSALLMMLTADIIVTAFTVYFFIKVVKTPEKSEQDFPAGP